LVLGRRDGNFIRYGGSHPEDGTSGVHWNSTVWEAGRGDPSDSVRRPFAARDPASLRVRLDDAPRSGGGERRPSPFATTRLP